MPLRKHAAVAQTGDHQVIVITHTDVRKDNRILKTIKAIVSLGGIQVFAVGVANPESIIPDLGQGIPNLRIHNIGSGIFFGFLRDWSNRIFPGAPAKNSIVIRIAYTILTTLGANLSAFLVALKEIDRAKIRVIYCNDAQSLLVASVLSAITPSKLVYDAHELEHHMNGQPLIERKFVLRWEKFFWPSVDFFITVSESIRLHYLETLGPKPSAVVLNSPNASGDPQRTSSIGDVRSVLGLDLEDTILLYAGAFSEGRGIQLLLECAEKLPPNHHLVFLGEGQLFPKIARSAEALRQVHVTSPVPHDRVVDFISTADIGLCLLEPVSMSDKFALPNKFFDYAFAGLPILYSDFPEMSKVAEIYGLGEKCENSVDSILRAVSRLKGTRTERASLAPLSWEYQEKVVSGVVNSFLQTH